MHARHLALCLAVSVVALAASEPAAAHSASFGVVMSADSQPIEGERTIERLLSASVTCRLRKQSLFAYLTQVITAHARGDPTPGLA